MKWSHPIEYWALIAVFSSDISGIGIIFRSCGWLMLMDDGMLPLFGCVECVAWWVPLFLLSFALFLLLTCLLIRLRFHCSGTVVPLSPSLESWCMMNAVGVDIGISPPLSCIELEVVLVVFFFWIDISWWNGSSRIVLGFSFDAMLARSPLSCIEMNVVLVVLFFWIDMSWWNDSIKIWLEFSFDTTLARSKHSSSDSDEVTSRREISLRRGFYWFDALNGSEVDAASVELGMLSWSITRRLPYWLRVRSSESLRES